MVDLKIKLDRAIVGGIEQNRPSKTIVRVALALRNLLAEVIAMNEQCRVCARKDAAKGKANCWAGRRRSAIPCEMVGHAVRLRDTIVVTLR